VTATPSARARGIADHRDAVARFLSTAADVPEHAWRQPRPSGKWSADEITTHLRLALEALARELAGGEPMRRVLSRPRELYARWVYLPRILKTGRFPAARAPREIRPGSPGLSREEAIRRLRSAAESVETACADSGSRCVTHPYFGRIALDAMLRLFARHTDHHERQLREAASSRSRQEGGGA
jgi:hypothetical protein